MPLPFSYNDLINKRLDVPSFLSNVAVGQRARCHNEHGQGQNHVSKSNYCFKVKIMFQGHRKAFVFLICTSAFCSTKLRKSLFKSNVSWVVSSNGKIHEIIKHIKSVSPRELQFLFSALFITITPSSAENIE